MNIICNTCVGGNLFSDHLKTEFKNPFIWSIILENDMYNLIKNYDKINFNNIKLRYIEKLRYYCVNIDNKVNVFYVHYIKDDNAKTIIKNNADVYYCNIEKYVKEKYFERLKKMKEEPVFVIAGGSYAHHRYSNEMIQKIIDLNSRFKLIVVLDQNHNVRCDKNKNVKKIVIKDAYTKCNTKDVAKAIFSSKLL